MKGTKRVALFIAGVLLLTVVASPLFSSGQEEGTYNMRMATPLSEQGTVGRALKEFASLVEDRSDGRIETQVSFSGELGTQREQVEMVQSGSLEVVTTLASGTARYVPQLGLFEFPYIYEDNDHLVRVLDELEDYVSELLAPHNFVAIGGQNMGFRHMLNTERPIEVPDDVEGLTMRGPNPVYVGMFEALGAEGTTTDWSEIYSAMQTGVIDGMEASPDMILSMNFHEVAEYLSETNHIAACVYYMINKEWLEGLPDDLRQIVEESAVEAAEYQNQLNAEEQDEALQTLVDEGVQVNAAEVAQFQTQLESWKQSYVAEQGSEWEELYERIQAVD